MNEKGGNKVEKQIQSKAHKSVKQDKGITLIALIITIVVLLILAAVAISSITNEGILGHAGNSATKYNEAVKNEQDMLQGYVNYLNNHTGSSTGEADGGEDDSGSETYSAYAIGDTVTIGTESFYVIEASDATTEIVVLLAKDKIDTTTYKQNANASGVFFSSTDYWSSEFTSSPYDLVESGEPSSDHYAAYHAYKYAKAIDESATGRLMTYGEAAKLKATNDTLKNMIYGTESTNGYINYWLGSAFGKYSVWTAYGRDSFGDSDLSGASRNNKYGVRPVVTISKSLLS